LIDKAEAQINAGQCMSALDADVELARRRTEWLHLDAVAGYLPEVDDIEFEDDENDEVEHER